MHVSQDAYSKTKMMAAFTVGLVLLMVAVKTYLYVATGAASFLASLIDSLTDLFVSGVTWMGVRWASKPADDNHRYGHGKMEALIGLFQFLIVSAAALTLAWQAGDRLATPQPLSPTFLDIGLTIGIFAANSFLVSMQNRVIKETGSLAIRGDQAHYASDLLGNGALLVLLILNMVGSFGWLDPVFTAMIAVVLLSAAGKVGRDSINTLLDHEAPEEVRLQLLESALKTPGVSGVHDLRVIESGLCLRVLLDIEVDGHLSLSAAHDISKEVERALLVIAPSAEIMIHIDPVGELEDSRHEKLEPHHFS